MYGGLLLEDYDQFQTIKEETYSFVDFIAPDYLLVWEEGKMEAGGIHHEVCKGIKVYEVAPDVLKEIKVWGKLSQEVKSKFNVEEAPKEEIKPNRSKVSKRRGRKPGIPKEQRYPGFPDYVNCNDCGKEQVVYHAAVAKKLKKDGITIEQYVKTYKCQKCNPTVGRRRKK
jgi:hypothetical protein